MNQKETVIAFHYTPSESSSGVELLIASLNKWAGRFKEAERWLYEIPELESKSEIEPPSGDFLLFRPNIPIEILRFPFAAKIFMAAEAEAQAEKFNHTTLIWLDEDTLFIQEPTRLLLSPGKKIALTPVHLKNISSLWTEPMNAYWETVFHHCQVGEKLVFPVRSSADHAEIRAHFNAGLLCLNPQVGILRKWKENFLSVYQNPQLSAFYQQDIRFQIFIHQAVLSATILQLCARNEIKLLPNTYNFPLHLVGQMNKNEGPASLDQLVTARYDDFSNTHWKNALPMGENYQKWLNKEFDRIGLN